MNPQTPPQAPQQAMVLGTKRNLQELLGRPNVSLTLEQVATKWLSADQIRTQAAIAVSRNPALLGCTATSFLEAMVRAAELGLRFAGAGGEAFLVPYKTSCTLIIGYRGLCALARRTGQVTRIEARVVHEKDVFEFRFGNEQVLEHRPFLGPDRGQIVAAYAIAELKNSQDQIEVMSRAELDDVRKRSPSGTKGPWCGDFSEMARKTVLRRLCKYLPFATAYDDVLAVEDGENGLAPEQDPERKAVAAVDIPEVDSTTGEILGEAAEQFISDADDAGPADPPFPAEDTAPAKPSDLAAQKRSVLDQIKDEMGVRFPGDSPAAQAARLKTLAHVFGSPDPNKMSNLPLDILRAGLEYLKNQPLESVVREPGEGE